MNIFLWIVQILLALLFTFAGVSKFLMPVDEMTKNMPAFMSLGFIYFIGVCEVLGAIGLIVPWLTKVRPGLTPLAAIGLMIIMIGATYISAIGNIPQSVFPALTGVLCGIVAWGRSRKTV
jgi:uncharacterized membrane protein YphA (DoxX/SURF4 family)